MKNQGNKKIKKKTISILLVIALCVAVIAMNSYAFWSITATQSGTNAVSSGCFDLSFTEGDAISLGSQFPIIDADSENLSPYTFTITNTCNIYASYQVNLEVLPVQGTETKLEDQYVKVSINNSNKKILTEHEEVEPTISGATASYKLTTGELAENESITYDLREWLEENTPLSQVNTSFRSKITVIAVPTTDPVFMASEPLTNPIETDVFWGGPIGRDLVEEISFTTSNEVPAGVIGSWDVSEEQNGKVMAWYTDTDANGKYEVVVGANGGVYAPENSNSLFHNFRNLNSLNLTNLNTSRTTGMAAMFYYTGYNNSTFTLYLGDNFDTSSVTYMGAMFYYTGYSNTIFTLDLGDRFDTSNVTNMNNMFEKTGHNSTTFTLDLGDKFDTSNVVNMYMMFFYTGYNSPAFTLDLGDKFNTSKVTNMGAMFASTGYSNPNFTLDLGDKFVTSNVTNMNDLFYRTGYNSTIFTLNLGDKFDTSKVTTMRNVFGEAGYNSQQFVTLDLGDKFNTSNVTDMDFMFNMVGNNASNFTLNLGNKFDVSKVTTMYMIFRSYRGANFTINAKNIIWNSVAPTTNMFQGSKATHTFYAKDANATSFISNLAVDDKFNGTVIDCSTTTCP